MGRYKIIKTGENISRMNNCPIYAEKYHILLDTNTNTNVLQIKFKNTDVKNIKSIFLSIDCYDDSKDFLYTLDNIAYVGLNVTTSQTFGDRQAITTDKNIIGNISIKVIKVVFTDESVWRNENNTYLEEIPAPESSVRHFDNLYNQYIRECKKSNIKLFSYAYTSHNDYWQCSCGKPNDKDRKTCFNCNVEKDTLEKITNLEYLTEENNKFEELEKERIIAEENDIKEENLTVEKQELQKPTEEENNYIATSDKNVIYSFINDKVLYYVATVLFAIYFSSNIYELFKYHNFYFNFYNILYNIDTLFFGVLILYLFIAPTKFNNRFINKLLPISLCILSIDNLVLFFNSLVIDLSEGWSLRFDVLGYGQLILGFSFLAIDYFTKSKKPLIFYFIPLITSSLEILIYITYLDISTLISLCTAFAFIIIYYFKIVDTLHAKKETINTIQAPERVFCTQCGKENDINSTYCTSCGHKLK